MPRLLLFRMRVAPVVTPGPGRVGAAVRRAIRPKVAPPRGLLGVDGVLMLQRFAGNRAVARLVVQRCGDMSPERCPCHAEDERKAGESGGAAVQRLTESE